MAGAPSLIGAHAAQGLRRSRGTTILSEDFFLFGRLLFLDPGSIPAAPTRRGCDLEAMSWLSGCGAIRLISGVCRVVDRWCYGTSEILRNPAHA